VLQAKPSLETIIKDRRAERAIHFRLRQARKATSVFSIEQVRKEKRCTSPRSCQLDGTPEKVLHKMEKKRMKDERNDDSHSKQNLTGWTG
jgi:hypothetical protein